MDVTAQRLTVYHFAGDADSWAYRLRINGEELPVTATPNFDEQVEEVLLPYEFIIRGDRIIMDERITQRFFHQARSEFHTLSREDKREILDDAWWKKIK